MKPVSLGPFVLERRIGAGGTGLVYSGKHVDSGLPVAIKVLVRNLTSDQEKQLFMNEAKAVAALDHPGIVWLLDVGTVNERVSARSGGVLPYGAPYLAMEYASGGTLQSWKPTSFEDVKPLVRQLLAGLGHAHASGFVHCDLKPANVLISKAPDPRPGFKITDFGIAASPDSTSAVASLSSKVMGTLRYMAPEQILGDWRNYGAWTDLYALGGVLFRVVSGLPTYSERKVPTLMAAKLQNDPQAFQPRFEVPKAFEIWLLRLLRRDHRNRYLSAAHALCAFEEAISRPEIMVPAPFDPDEDTDVEFAPTEIGLPRGDGLVQEVSLTGTTKALAVPDHWRRYGQTPAPPVLMGAGLSLFEMRTVPLIGREKERDVLWAELLKVQRSGAPVVATLRGPEGFGKSRLMHWIAAQAHERAGWRVLQSPARSDEAPEMVLRRGLRRWTRVKGLSPEDAKKRIFRLFTDTELARDVYQLLGFGRQVLDGRSRRGVLARALAYLSPVVWLMDDAHHSVEAAEFAAHLLESRLQSKVLCVLGWRDDLAPAHVRDRLTELRLRKDVVGLVVNRLSATEQAELIRSVLHFDPAVVARIEQQTAGNPRYAIRLVRERARTGHVLPGPVGYTLSPDAPPLTTESDIWTARIARICAGVSSDALLCLERAAVLGMEVHLLDWQRVCDDPEGRHGPPSRPNQKLGELRAVLTDRLVENRLIKKVQTKFFFVSQAFRDALLQQAKLGQRLQMHHKAAVHMLLQQGSGRGSHERVARHLVKSGLGSLAVDHFLAAVNEVRAGSGDLAAIGLLAEAEEALVSAEQHGSAKQADIWLRRAELYSELEHGEPCFHWAEQAVVLCRSLGLSQLIGRALYASAQGLILERRLQEAAIALDEAEEHTKPQEQLALGQILYSQALLAGFRGDDEEAANLRNRAVALVGASTCDPAHALLLLSKHAYMDQDIQSAERYGNQALKAYRKLQNTHREAECLNLLGDLCRLQGNEALAKRRLNQALRIYDREGSPNGLYPRLNLALIALAHQEYAQAWEHGQAAYRWVKRRTNDPMAAAVHGILVHSAAGLHQWGAMEVALGVLELIGCEDDEVMNSLGEAGLLANGHRRPDLAKRCYRLASQRFDRSIPNENNPWRARLEEMKEQL